MSTTRPIENVFPAISVTSALPSGDAGNATILLHGAGLALFEVTAVSGLTGTVEGLTTENGTWRQIDCYQSASGTATHRTAGTTITFTAADFIYVPCRGFRSVRIKRAAGTSATFTVRTAEDATAYLLGLMYNDSSALPAGTNTVGYVLDGSIPLVELSIESNISISASAQIFANAPAATKEVWLSLETAGVRIRTDGSAATSTTGQPFLAGTVAPHVFRKNQAALLKFYAIGFGGTAVANIVYWG